MLFENQIIIIIVFAVYMLLVFSIGIVASRKTKTEEDFFLGGRKLGPWVTAISSTASSESGWVILGTVGLVYKDGLSASWFLPGCLIGYWFNWKFVAPLLRRRSLENDSITVPDFISFEVGEKNHAVRLIAVIIIFLSMMAYVAAQLTAAGKAFSALFSIEYSTSILIGSTIVIIYTLMGGFRAVSWTDLLQGILMVCALILLPVIALVHIGGFEQLQVILSKYPGFLSPVKSTGIYFSIGSILGLLGIGLGYPGQPHVLARFMAASDDSVIRRGKVIALAWGFFVYSGAITLGLAGKALIPDLADPEHLFPNITVMLLHPVLAGVMLSAIMSAIMSTADSQLLVASSSLVRDIYEKILGRSLEQKRLLITIRLSILVLGLMSVLIALTDVRIIFWFVLFAWSGLGAGLGPLVILLLRGYKFKPFQAVTGMLIGFLVTILWKTEVFDMIFNVQLSKVCYELIPAFIFSLVYLLIVGRKSIKSNS